MSWFMKMKKHVTQEELVFGDREPVAFGVACRVVLGRTGT